MPQTAAGYLPVVGLYRATIRLGAKLALVTGWDEAFLGARTDDPFSLARTIQRAVREAASLDCSVGIGQNKLQAKIATGFGKPAGVFAITNETWRELLGPRPTDALWGIGSRTARKLARRGVLTRAHLAPAHPPPMAAHFGPT